MSKKMQWKQWIGGATLALIAIVVLTLSLFAQEEDYGELLNSQSSETSTSVVAASDSNVGPIRWTELNLYSKKRARVYLNLVGKDNFVVNWKVEDQNARIYYGSNEITEEGRHELRLPSKDVLEFPQLQLGQFVTLTTEINGEYQTITSEFVGGAPQWIQIVPVQNAAGLVCGAYRKWHIDIVIAQKAFWNGGQLEYPVHTDTSGAESGETPYFEFPQTTEQFWLENTSWNDKDQMKHHSVTGPYTNPCVVPTATPTTPTATPTTPTATPTTPTATPTTPTATPTTPTATPTTPTATPTTPTATPTTPTATPTTPTATPTPAEYNLYLPAIAKGEIPTVTPTPTPIFYGLAVALDPEAVDLGEHTSPPAQMAVVDWTKENHYVSAEAEKWIPAIVDANGKVRVEVWLKHFRTPTYVSGLRIDGVEMSPENAIVDPSFWLQSRLLPFKDKDGNKYMAWEVHSYFPAGTTGLFVDWRNQILSGTTAASAPENEYAAIGDAAQ